MKKILTLLICVTLPKIIKPFCLNLIGHKVDRSSKISISFIFSSELKLSKNTRIGFFNLIYNTKITMDEGSYIGRRNVINGPFIIHLKADSALGKNNKISRGKIGVSYGEARLELGILTKITADHHIDVTRNVIFGDYSILAGIRSQIWTHGYVHAPLGPNRFRVDGEVIIGNNVYIGSGCLLNPGISIADTINIGGNCTISKSLKDPGMYVSQPLRHLEKDYQTIKEALTSIEVNGLVEEVYEK